MEIGQKKLVGVQPPASPASAIGVGQSPTPQLDLESDLFSFFMRGKPPQTPPT